MIDDAKRLVRKYPHIALGCCGIYLILVPFMISGYVKLIDPYLTHPPPWLFIVTVELTALAMGVVLVGIAILWGLRRRRSAISDAARPPQSQDSSGLGNDRRNTSPID